MSCMVTVYTMSILMFPLCWPVCTVSECVSSCVLLFTGLCNLAKE